MPSLVQTQATLMNKQKKRPSKYLTKEFILGNLTLTKEN